MTWSPAQIANAIDGTMSGNQNSLIRQINGLELADETSVSFLLRESYAHYLHTSKAAVIVMSADRDEKPQGQQCFIKVKDILLAMKQVSSLFEIDKQTSTQSSSQTEISPSAYIHESVKIGSFSIISEDAQVGEGTSIGSQVYIGPGVIIGKHCNLYAGVKVYAHTQIGNHVIIHSNAVIGADGFGYLFMKDQFEKIEHLGNVIIEDNVEIGSNTVIDRAVFDSTIIRKGTKLDNLIQVAHNVEIGKHTMIAAQTGISGSSKVGRYVQLGGQVGLAGHIEIADGSQVQAQSGIASSITEKNKKWYGYPILPYRVYLRSYALFKRLPELFKQLKEMRKDLDQLKNSKE